MTRKAVPKVAQEAFRKLARVNVIASLRAVDVLEAAAAQVVLDEDRRVKRVLPLPRQHHDALAQRGQRRHSLGVEVRLHVGQVPAAPHQVLRGEGGGGEY